MTGSGRHTTNTCVAVVIVAVCTVGNGTRAQDPKTTFRSGTSAVMVDAAVRDKNRRVITGLAAEDFEVYDNGVRQRVEQVSYGKLPIDVTVALDISQSVSGTLLERLRRGVIDLMRDLSAQDRLRLMLFNMRVSRTSDYTTDVKAIERAIRTSTAWGGTALLDALSVALVSPSPVDRRQLIVAFTDGSDTSSTTSPSMLTMVAQRTRATLAFVMPSAAPMVTTTINGRVSVVGGAVPASRGSHELLFSALVRETGGSMVPVGPTTDLSAAFRRVLGDFRSAYVLYYSPNGVERTGYHQIEVKVKRDGAQVQARRGYFGS